MKRNQFVVLVIFILFTTSCDKNKTGDSSIIQFKVEYLHISHTRTNANPSMVDSVKEINYSKYDMLWLGGDLAYLSSENNETMTHIDSIFDFGDSNTLWSLGNHDYTDLDLVSTYTNRPRYFAYANNGITFLVIDTQDSLSSIVSSQLELIQSVVDSIQESSHLIILHHKLIWMNDNGSLESQIDSISNVEFGNCFYCINSNNFYEEIYPKLVEVKQKGIEVICIGGDLGIKVNEFEFVTPEGIYLLASGISYEADENKALLFYHDLTSRELSWEFKLISEL